MQFRKRFYSLVSAALIVSSFGIAARAEFAVRDGDTVVFLGDSITAARQYGKIIENYTLLRFPERKVKFINAGRGGETAKQSLDRLDKAVFEQGATVLTVAYGINDIGWGAKADAEHKQDYLDAIAQIIERCQKHNVRVFICSAAITAEEPDKAEKNFLQNMCDEALALAKSKDAGAIDVQRTMRAAQRKMLAFNTSHPKDKPNRLHVEDGVHLNELGQMAMAFAILKGLGAPADVSSAEIDAGSGAVVASSACKIRDIEHSDKNLSFTRLDERLPLNLAPLWMLQGMFIPIGDELNRYMLTVKGLPEGTYEMKAGGRPLGKWKASELARGISIASATANGWVPGGPWDAQGHALKVFTDIRDELVFARQGINSDLSAHPQQRELIAHADAIEQNLIELQRQISHPIPVAFELQLIARPNN